MVEETLGELPGEPPSTGVRMLSLENGTVRISRGTLCTEMRGTEAEMSA